MSVPKAVIAEDEPVLRAQLVEVLAAVWPELVICAEAADGIQAMRALSKHKPDILFLDIEMPGMSGLEIARKASGKCHVVFVTAYDKYAVAAFEQGAVDYVMKPFSAARLTTTMSRLMEKSASSPANLDGFLESLAAMLVERKQYLRWITASQGQNLRLITVEEICYFEVDNKYTLVTTLRTSDGTVLGTFGVGSCPEGAAFDGTNIWVANYASSNVTKLRASDGAVLGTFAVGMNPTNIAFDGANVRVVNSVSNTVSKL